MKTKIQHQIKVLWLFIKCQLITKTVTVFILYPLYRMIIEFLLRSSGRTVFSSGDFLSFLLSINGLGIIIISLILMTFLIGLDINTFIIISSLIQEKILDIKVRAVLIEGIKSLKKMINLVGLIMMCFIAVIFPLLGFVSISLMSDFKIPNFITAVIYANSLYALLYLGLLIFLSYIAIRYIFTFHYVLINKDSIKQGLKNSVFLTRKKVWFIIRKSIVKLLKKSIILLVAVFIFIATIIVLFAMGKISESSTPRFETVLLLIVFSEMISFFIFLSSPIMILILTELFYELNNQQDVHIKYDVPETFIITKKRRHILMTTLLGLSFVGIIVFNIFIASIVTYFFDELFENYNSIELVAHRGGGDLDAENTIQGVQRAIEQQVDWTEIDVQRTKDGYYIINHDSSFNRLSNVKKSSSEMTLAEIKTLQVKNLFDSSKPSQSIATLEEMIVLAKDKIGLFIELKGKTADYKMVDDVVKLVKQYQLEKVVLLSLDYNLITYIEQYYPEMKTGYLYYFAIGKVDDLKGDYLIMEEQEATPEKIEQLKAKGKKVVVWTVNTAESISTFVASNVDGIITDYVLKVKEAMKQYQQRSDWEKIIDTIFK